MKISEVAKQCYPASTAEQAAFRAGWRYYRSKLRERRLVRAMNRESDKFREKVQKRVEAKKTPSNNTLIIAFLIFCLASAVIMAFSGVKP